MRTHSILGLLSLTLLCASGSRAQTCSADVQKVEQQILEATRLDDVKTLDTLLADGFVVVSATGVVTERDHLLERKTKAGAVYKRLEADHVDVRCHGASAIVIATATIEFAPESLARHSGQYRYVRVYTNEDGHWKAALLQLAKLPEAATAAAAPPAAAPAPSAQPK